MTNCLTRTGFLMQHQRSARCASRAFTLVELLVVIAIISLLIAIVLPSMQRARQQAKDIKCLAQLRDMFVATQTYINEQRRLPPLNNDLNEGAWQYNYLIYDGGDYDQCFGPLAQPDGPVKQTQVLFCPVQESPFHQYMTQENPWPVVRNSDTRAGYSRRHGLTGKTLTEFREVVAFAADLLHESKFITESGHVTGVNVVYIDGHGKYVRDKDGVLTDNDLAHPFDPLDNPVVERIWKFLDRGGQ
jgi:prepilin-type N-terminal cleavage/methylation domain-containing protein